MHTRLVFAWLLLSIGTATGQAADVPTGPATGPPAGPPDAPCRMEFLGPLQVLPARYQAMAFLDWGEERHLFAHAAGADGRAEKLHIVDSTLQVIREIPTPGRIVDMVDLTGGTLALLIEPPDAGTRFVLAMDESGQEAWRFSPDEGVSHLVARGAQGKVTGIAVALQDAALVVGLDLEGHTCWSTIREGTGRITDMSSELGGDGRILVCAASVQVVDGDGVPVDTTDHDETPSEPMELQTALPASLARAAIEGRFTVRARLLQPPVVSRGDVVWIAQGVRVADRRQLLWRQDLAGNVAWERELAKRPDAWCLVPELGVLLVDGSELTLLDVREPPPGGALPDACKTSLGTEPRSPIEKVRTGQLGDERAVALASLSGLVLYRVGP